MEIASPWGSHRGGAAHDAVAGESCPYWPGRPMTAHWGIPDPAVVEGIEADDAH
jgi:hypothetical protein